MRKIADNRLFLYYHIDSFYNETIVNKRRITEMLLKI